MSPTVVAEEVTETEMILPVELDAEDLGVLMQNVPTPTCGGGGLSCFSGVPYPHPH